jgi:hypothetical protein
VKKLLIPDKANTRKLFTYSVISISDRCMYQYLQANIYAYIINKTYFISVLIISLDKQKFFWGDYGCW